LGPGWYDPESDRPYITFHDDFADPRAGGRAHNGLDVGAHAGALVTSMFTGRVTSAGWDNLGGYGVVTRSKGKRSGVEVTAYYGHMASRPFVKLGAKVHPGDPLGLVGRSGGGPEGSLISSGAHVHIWIRVDGNPVNPFPLLRDYYGESGRVRVIPGPGDDDLTRDAIDYVRGARLTRSATSTPTASEIFNKRVGVEYVTIFPSLYQQGISLQLIRAIARRNVYNRDYLSATQQHPLDKEQNQ
jgi:hypothetical protein